MFVRQTQQQFRNSNADVQFFYGDGSQRSWVKPVGVSQIYMMLIGGGAGGNAGTNGGGSGAVTTWFGPAQNVPNNLIISASASAAAGASGGNTYVYYQTSSSTLVALLSANGGLTGSGGGTAMTANQFSNMGLFQSVAGQAGSTSANTAASATTFLSGGSGSSQTNGNYGYLTTTNGFLQLQPIIVGVAGNTATVDTVLTGAGCGGAQGVTTGCKGGQGLVIIASR